MVRLQSGTESISITTPEPIGMIALRGDLQSPVLSKAIENCLSIAIPMVGKIEKYGENSLAWMAPDELLIMVPLLNTDSVINKLRESLTDIHNLVVDVSDMRATIELSGSGWRDVLAKLTPANVAPDTFSDGSFCRSRLGQIAAAFWIIAKNQIWIICRTSEQEYAWNLIHSSIGYNRQPHYFRN